MSDKQIKAHNRLDDVAPADLPFVKFGIEVAKKIDPDMNGKILHGYRSNPAEFRRITNLFQMMQRTERGVLMVSYQIEAEENQKSTSFNILNDIWVIVIIAVREGVRSLHQIRIKMSGQRACWEGANNLRDLAILVREILPA